MTATAPTAAATSLTTVTLEAADPAAVHRFHTAFGVAEHVRMRPSTADSTGFRGFTLALTVSGPATVDGFLDAAMSAGATVLKPAAKSLWGESAPHSPRHRPDARPRTRGNPTCPRSRPPRPPTAPPSSGRRSPPRSGPR